MGRCESVLRFMGRKGDKKSECKLSNGWLRSYEEIKLLLSARNEWSRSYRGINQHPNLPWNFITHGFLDNLRKACFLTISRTWFECSSAFPLFATFLLDDHCCGVRFSSLLMSSNNKPSFMIRFLATQNVQQENQFSERTMHFTAFRSKQRFLGTHCQKPQEIAGVFQGSRIKTVHLQTQDCYNLSLSLSMLSLDGQAIRNANRGSSRKPIRRKAPIFITFERFAGIASNLRFAKR